jgi:hypothetical protein
MSVALQVAKKKEKPEPAKIKETRETNPPRR